MKLRAVEDTIFKVHPIESSKLHWADKISIAKGKTLEVHSYYELDDEHMKVAFKEPVLGSLNTVCVYMPHVVFEGVENNAHESVKPDFTGEINWHNPNCRITPYFTVREVTQGDSRRIPKAGSEVEANVLKLARRLDQIREEWGHPLGCTSWYRPEPINSQVGGVRGSAHTRGFAADIYPMSGGSIQDFQAWLDKRWKQALGYGARKGFVHIDLRSYRRWNY